VSQIDQQGGNATEVAVFANGSYSVYVLGFSTDYPIAPKEGFWVLTKSPAVWALT
jgi:hypothetical protein